MLPPAPCATNVSAAVRATTKLETASRRPLVARWRIQIVFQNPYDSLNPRHRVSDAIARPARILRGLSRDEARAEVENLPGFVRLLTHVAERFPGELSGGECQRVAIEGRSPRPRT